MIKLFLSQVLCTWVLHNATLEAVPILALPHQPPADGRRLGLGGTPMLNVGVDKQGHTSEDEKKTRGAT